MNNLKWIYASLCVVLAISIAVSSVYSQLSQSFIRTAGYIRANLIVGVDYWKGNSERTFTLRDLPLLRSVGVKHLRLGSISRADFENCDALIDACQRNDIDVIATLAEESNFSDYVYDVVSHFKGRVNGWIVLNEANWDGYRNNPVGYTDLLQVAYTQAKRADPSVLVLTSNLLSTDSLAYLNEMYMNGAKDFFDVLAIDPYCVGVSPLEPNRDPSGHSFWELPKFRDLMVRYGDVGKSIWVVEMGWRTPDPYGWFYVGDNNGTVTEATQALYVQQALELASTWPWVQRYYHYEWMDSYDPTVGYFGLIRENYNPPYETKPSYQAVKDFLNMQFSP